MIESSKGTYMLFAIESCKNIQYKGIIDISIKKNTNTHKAQITYRPPIYNNKPDDKQRETPRREPRLPSLLFP